MRAGGIRMRTVPANVTSTALRRLPSLMPADQIASTGKTVSYELVLTEGEWSPLKGAPAPAILTGGSAPGPVLRATEGDLVRVTVVNRLREPTAIHFHGVVLPNAMDGVPPITQAPIGPGERFVYEFVAPHAGTYMYHSHMPGHSIKQIGRGLYGVLIVSPQQEGREPAYAVDMPLIIGTWQTENREVGMMGAVWAVNGTAHPETPPIRVREGDLVRLRWLNLTNSYHPMHLHGHDFRVIAEDGHPLPQPRILHTVDLAPGKIIDVDFLANNPGTWLFHCHVLMHMMPKGGLTVLITYDR